MECSRRPFFFPVPGLLSPHGGSPPLPRSIFVGPQSFSKPSGALIRLEGLPSCGFFFDLLSITLSFRFRAKTDRPEDQFFWPFVCFATPKRFFHRLQVSGPLGSGRFCVSFSFYVSTFIPSCGWAYPPRGAWSLLTLFLVGGNGVSYRFAHLFPNVFLPPPQS